MTSTVLRMIRAHSFPRQNLTNSATNLVNSTANLVNSAANLVNSAANLVNSAAHRGKAEEIPRLTADTQLNFRGLIKS